MPKKKKSSGLTRSEAAKKGWQTRRKNEKTLKEIGVSLEADFETKRQALEQYYLVKTMTLKASLGVITIKDALELIPPQLHQESIKKIIQSRLDRSSRMFGDVRIEAWDLADELDYLDWDISDVYDAWEYEENVA